MSEVKEKDIEAFSTEELLRLDLGKDIYQVFEFIQNLGVVQNNVSVPDPAYYRRLITEARGHASTVRQEVSKVLRAKTKAQSRLTSRTTRYQILLEDKLENDVAVQAGVSIEDRKARAANTLVSLKNSINEAKNEVEALKNLKQALDVTLRDFNAMCSDFREQAKLLQEELKRLPQLPPNGNDVDSGASFAGSVKDIEEKYGIGVTVASVGLEPEVADELTIEDEEESSDPTDDLIAGMMDSFASVSPSVSLEIPDLQADDMTVGEESPPDLATQEGVQQTLDVDIEADMGYTLPGEEFEETPEDSTGGESSEEISLDLPDTDLSLPEETPDFDLEVPDSPALGTASGDSSDSMSMEIPGGTDITPERPTNSEESAFDMYADSDDEVTVEDDLDFIGNLFNEEDISDQVEGYVSEELSLEAPSLSLTEDKEIPLTEETASNDEVSDEVTQDFEVASVSTTEPKMSKHFAETEEEKVPDMSMSMDEPLESKAAPSTPEKNADTLTGIDELLGALLGG